MGTYRGDRTMSGAHGIMPADLDRRLHEQELDLPTCHLAKLFARELEGRRPLGAAPSLRHDLRDAWSPECVERALVALDRAGYGRQRAPKPRRLRGHGSRIEERERIKGLVGKLPRAVALRLPTTSNNLLFGRRDGRDVWGEVRCNLTLRDGALGILAIAGGLWVKDSKPGERHVELSAGEAAYLLRARRRASRRTSGRDIRWVYEQLADLAALELSAEGGGDGHEIPCSPVKRVLPRWYYRASARRWKLCCSLRAAAPTAPVRHWLQRIPGRRLADRANPRL